MSISNIKLIIKKIQKNNKKYFFNENYNDFYKEFEYTNNHLILINLHDIFNYISNILYKNKFIALIIILVIIILVKINIM
jgi:hypothetical protein